MKKRAILIALGLLAALAIPGLPSFAAVTVNYPADYTYVTMPGYQADWFANASQTPISAAIRTQQSTAAANMFALVFKGTGATPHYTNMWGTYSTSQKGAHEGIDMVYGSQGQPLYCWIKSGVVTNVQSTDGLVTIYYSKLNRTIFYRHMYSISVTAGQTVKQGDLIGTEGMRGNATGVHLHTAVMDGNVSSETADDNYFASSNPYTTFINM